MDLRTILRDRTHAILVDLEQLETALGVYEPKAMRAARTWGALRNDLEQSKKKVDGLLDAIERDFPESLWDQLAGLGSAVQASSREILALLQGGILRDAEPDGGIYALADALVQEVADAMGEAWGGLTIPGERDAIQTKSALIRLAFPEVSIWDLPVTLHEFGHYVAPRILNEVGQRPYDLMCEAAGSAAERAHITELFADLFASYASGPAFACNLILLRLDPSSDAAAQDGATHPSHDRRVWFVLRVLAERSREIGDARWKTLVDELSLAWHASREHAEPEAAAGAEAVPDQGLVWPGREVPSADHQLFARLYRIAECVPNGRYRDWWRARLLVRVFHGDAGARVQLEEGTTLRDVVNGAWLARVERPDAAFDIEDRAKRYCRTILKQAVDRPGGGQLD